MRFLSVTGRRSRSTGVFIIAVSAVVLSLTAASPALAVTADDCVTARSFGYTQTDIEIAADAALAADVILEAIPQDTLDVIPRTAAVVLWAIPQGVLRGFEHSYDIAGACDDSDHQALVKDNLDAKVSTRATQTSLNALQTSLNSFRTAFDANATLLVTKLDSISTALADHAKLDLRLKIESDLSDSLTSSPIALFELPASSGGYIELARSIVAELITKMQAAGQPVLNAPKHLATGDAHLAAHKYKLAYASYASAYRDASR